MNAEYTLEVLLLLLFASGLNACWSSGTDYDYGPAPTPPPSQDIKDGGWPEHQKQKPYDKETYDDYLKHYAKKIEEKEKKAAEEAGWHDDLSEDEKNKIFGPHGGPTEDGIHNPNGPFGPNKSVTKDDLFGPNGPFGPNGDKWEAGKVPEPYGPYGPGGPDGDGPPYGPNSPYPPAWGKKHLYPGQAILDGVPHDVDMAWPDHWKDIGLPNTGEEPPKWAYAAKGSGKAWMCFLEPEHGECKDTQARWGYNPYKEECEEFEYSGCGGNENNFLTQQLCREVCLKPPTLPCSDLGDIKDLLNWPELPTGARRANSEGNSINNENTETNETPENGSKTIEADNTVDSATLPASTVTNKENNKYTTEKDKYEVTHDKINTSGKGVVLNQNKNLFVNILNDKKVNTNNDNKKEINIITNKTENLKQNEGILAKISYVINSRNTKDVQGMSNKTKTSR